jgi:hypothetical protein
MNYPVTLHQDGVVSIVHFGKIKIKYGFKN